MKRLTAACLVTGLVLAGVISCTRPVNPATPSPQAEHVRPNILLIMADDLGYGDLSAFGSEIPTPNLDRLAQGGLLFSSFHVSPVCSPTRASLMTGLPPQLAGFGTVPEVATPEQKASPAYRGHLDPEVETLAERLQAAGYRTLMAGKWHLGRDRADWPDQAGFERSFALLNGAASHFSDARGASPRDAVAEYVENGSRVGLPDDFFSTDFYTDRILSDMEAGWASQKPFFAYLAYTAPHFPLQAPDDWIDRFEGAYDAGFESVARERLRRMSGLGILGGHLEAAGLTALAAAWEILSPEERALSARRMEIYAAMVAHLDASIGRVIAYLDETGQRENTLIIFLSDNGPDFTRPELAPFRTEWIASEFDNSPENMGRKGSYISYGQHWAQVSAAPLRLFKATMAEGGTRVPAILNWQGRIAGGGQAAAFASVMDILPTLTELAVGEAAKIDGSDGRSLAPLFTDPNGSVHPGTDIFAGEMLASRAIIQGDYKLLYLPEPLGSGDWALYNLKSDPLEQDDLSLTLPEKRAQMLELWETYERETGIVPSPDAVTGPLLAVQ